MCGALEPNSHDQSANACFSAQVSKITPPANNCLKMLILTGTVFRAELI